MNYFESKKAYYKNKSGFISKLINIKGFIVAGLVLGLAAGFFADQFWLNELIDLGIVNSSVDLWLRVALMISLVMIPPYLLANSNESD